MKYFFKWLVISFLVLFVMLLIGGGIASLGIEPWSRLYSLWGNIGLYVAAASYGFYAFVAFNWKESCNWFATKMVKGDGAIELGRLLSEKKMLAITVVIFLELIAWTSRLKS